MPPRKVSPVQSSILSFFPGQPWGNFFRPDLASQPETKPEEHGTKELINRHHSQDNGHDLFAAPVQALLE